MRISLCYIRQDEAGVVVDLDSEEVVKVTDLEGPAYMPDPASTERLLQDPEAVKRAYEIAQAAEWPEHLDVPDE